MVRHSIPLENESPTLSMCFLTVIMTVFFIEPIILKNERMVLIIITIKVWDNPPIDTSSKEIKNKVSKSISDYILNHWDKCVQIVSSESEGKYEVEFCITL